MLLVVFTTQSSVVFMVRCFSLLSHFLIVEGYELSQSTSQLLSVPLTRQNTSEFYFGPSLFC